MNFYKSKGILHYGSEFKITLSVDQQISDYYFSLIPKYKNPNRQKYKPHITVVRSNRENIQNFEYWNKYEGELIDFIYFPGIKFSYPYFFINIDSERLTHIREELGLKKYRFSEKLFHTTIANIKK